MAKYYLYISDQKVDMLLPQIPTKIKHKLSAEFGVDVGVFKARLQSERIAYEDRVHRLAVVERHIRSGDLGTLDNPKAWISDTAAASLGNFVENDKLVFFIGRSGKSNFVLGGSVAHLISRDPATDVSVGWSYIQDLLETLESTIANGADLALSEHDLVSSLSLGVGHPDSPSPWYNVIEVVQQRVRGPAIKIEFLAKRLAVGEASSRDGRLPILASPLYVAMAD